MRFEILAAAALAGSAFAQSACITSSEAATVASNFQSLIDQPFSTALANAALSPSFSDWSSSVNTLIDYGCTSPQPLDAATFTSLSAFIAGQSGQPPIPFTILKTWNNCDTVMIRWRSDAPGTVQPEEPVTGMIVLEVEPTGSGSNVWQIQTVYSEFNSGAWLYDLDVFVPTNCTSSKRSLRA